MKRCKFLRVDRGRTGGVLGWFSFRNRGEETLAGTRSRSNSSTTAGMTLGIGDQMQRLLTALATTLCGACASTPPRTDSPTGSESTHGADSHAHQRTDAHHNHGTGGVHNAFSDPNILTKVLDDPSRDEWQRPDDVLRALELEPTMVIADVGAGTGYFAARLARAVPQGEVIATDLEPDMVRFLGERARREQLSNLRPILATQTTSGLAARSVDRILIVHVWHHLADRREYARGLATALRPGGKLFIVDFSPTAHRGPPVTMRVAPEVVIAELEGAGLSAEVEPITLPDQYIVSASLAR